MYIKLFFVLFLFIPFVSHSQNKPNLSIQMLYQNRPYNIYDIDFTSDSQKIALAGDWGFVRVWDIRTGEMIHELFDIARGRGRGTMHSLDISSDDSMIVANGGGNVYMWDIENDSQLQTFEHFEHFSPQEFFTPFPYFGASAISNNGTIAASSINGIIFLWDNTNGEFITTVDTKIDDIVSHIQFTPNDQQIYASVRNASEYVIINRQNLELSHPYNLNRARIGRDGITLYGFNNENTITAVDIRTGNTLFEYKLDIPIHTLLFLSNDGSKLFVHSNGQNHLYSLGPNHPPKRIHTFPELDFGIMEAMFSPNGEYIALKGLRKIEIYEVLKESAVLNGFLID